LALPICAVACWTCGQIFAAAGERHAIGNDRRGFWAYGTNSLKLALEHLGFGPCRHIFEVRDNPSLLPDWEAAARGERVDWDKVFRGYRSQVDRPGARYWRELASHFPRAKVILSVRDPDAWFDSLQSTLRRSLRGTESILHLM